MFKEDYARDSMLHTVWMLIHFPDELNPIGISGLEYNDALKSQNQGSLGVADLVHPVYYITLIKEIIKFDFVNPLLLLKK